MGACSTGRFQMRRHTRRSLVAAVIMVTTLTVGAARGGDAPPTEVEQLRAKLESVKRTAADINRMCDLLSSNSENKARCDETKFHSLTLQTQLALQLTSMRRLGTTDPKALLTAPVPAQVPPEDRFAATAVKAYLAVVSGKASQMASLCHRLAVLMGNLDPMSLAAGGVARL
jgi:hypothetical protein